MHSHLGKHTIWIDGLCINQDDPADKAVQVAQMGSVYDRADSVITVLNSPTAETDFLLDQKNWASDTISAERSRMHKAMTTLLADDYWRRTWILQELVLGEDVTMCCGNRIATFQQLSRLFDDLNGTPDLRSLAGKLWRLFLAACKERPTNASQGHVRPHGGIFGEQDFAIFSCAGRKEYQNMPLLRLLQRSMRYDRCFDPKDMLYARRDLASDGARLIPAIDYSAERSVNDVYIDFAARCITDSTSSESLDIITYTSPCGKCELPSWVPDWRLPINRWLAESNIKGEIHYAGIGGTSQLTHTQRPSPHSGDHLSKLTWSKTSPTVSQADGEIIVTGRALVTLTSTHEAVLMKGHISLFPLAKVFKMGERNKVAKFAIDHLRHHYPGMTNSLEDPEPPAAGDVLCALKGCPAFVFLRPVEGPRRRYRITAKDERFQRAAMKHCLQDLVRPKSEARRGWYSFLSSRKFWKDVSTVNRLPEETFAII